MKLGPGKWRILVGGDTDAFLSAGGRSQETLRYLLGRLVAGDEVSVDELEYWGIEVRQLGDQDELIVVPRDPT